MIIQRLNKCYEVMSQLNSTSRMAEFLCREQELQETVLLVRITEVTLAKRFTLFLEEKIGGTKFPDYKGCFQSEGIFYAAFSYSTEKTLTDKLGTENYTVKEHAEIFRRLLEQMLLRSPHPYFMRTSLQPDMITVADSLDVDWNYHLDELGTFDYCTMEAVCGQLAELIKIIFEKELQMKQYFLLNEYFLVLEDGNLSDYLELYREFIPVYEAFCDEGSSRLPRTYLWRLWERCKKIVDIPGSLKGYFRMGKRYVAKKLAFVLTLFIILLPLSFLWLVYPRVQAGSLPKTMVIGSGDIEGYTGRVRLVGDLETDNVVFTGTLLEGRMDGQGTLYDAEGNLRYQGEFAEGQYEGEGKLYSEAGDLVYEGEFLGGLYEGNGTLYYVNGQIQYRGNFYHGLYEGTGLLFYGNGVVSYEGEFLQGEKSGNGKEFDESGELLYEGAFLQNQYEGEGILYNSGQVVSQGSFHKGILISGNGVIYDGQGNLRYQGGIKNERYDGQGILYSESILIYEGGFMEGIYHGSGRLYDAETGELKYEGGFYRGKYDGEGKLYDPAEGYLIYAGGFREDQYDGQGKSYEEGMLKYDGEFLLGTYNGKGTLYDPITGAVLFEGVFHNNEYVEMPACPEQEEEESETEMQISEIEMQESETDIQTAVNEAE